MDNKDMLSQDNNSIDNTDFNTKETGGAPATALEFEIADENFGFVFDSEADISVSLSDSEAQPPSCNTDTRTEVEADVMPEEFTIPDTLQLDEKYNTTSFIEDPRRMRTAYVPRFTEVSENYRMKDDPRRARTESRASTVSSSTAAGVVNDMDATSEIEEGATVEKVIVTSQTSSIEEPKDESITLFKFDASDDDGEEAPVSETLDDISGHCDIEQSDTLPDENDAAQSFEDNKQEEDSEEAREYELPNPAELLRTSDNCGITAEGLLPEEAPRGSMERSDKSRGGINGEYFSPIQKDNIKDKFLDTIMSVRVRLISALVVFLIMLSAEILYLCNVNVYSLLEMNVMAGMSALVDFAFCLCLVLLSLPELIRALSQLFKKKCLPEMFILAALIVLTVYTIVTVRLGGEIYPTFGMLFSIMIISSIFASYIKVKAEYEAFKILSKSSVKNVIDKRLTRTLPRENMALDGAIDEYKSNTARVFRTSFVSDFFGHAGIVCENTVNVILMLGIGTGLSLVTAVVCYFLGGGSLAYAINAFVVVFMMSCPAFSILLHKIPFGHANAEAGVQSSTFVGEGSLYSVADTDVIAYDDTEIFGIEDVSIKKVHMYGKVYNMPKAMQQMYSLFSVVGGPLDYVFANSLDRKGASATDIVIEDDGICGMLDGHKICAGTEEYMRRRGVAVPVDDNRVGLSATDTTKVMYGAEDDEVYVKFYIRYSFSEEFSMLLPHLKSCGIVPLIYTRDPNITGELLKVLTMGEDIIRVMKKNTPREGEKKIYRRISSGAVTLGDKTSAVNMVLLSKKYVAFQSAFSAGELVAMMVGAVLAIVFSISGVFVMPTFALALLQLGCCLFLSIRSKLTFRTGQKD